MQFFEWNHSCKHGEILMGNGKWKECMSHIVISEVLTGLKDSFFDSIKWSWKYKTEDIFLKLLEI